MKKEKINEKITAIGDSIGKYFMCLSSFMMIIIGGNFIINPLVGPWSDNNYSNSSLIGFIILGVIFTVAGVWIYLYTKKEKEKEKNLK